MQLNQRMRVDRIQKPSDRFRRELEATSFPYLFLSRAGAVRREIIAFLRNQESNTNGLCYLFEQEKETDE